MPPLAAVKTPLTGQQIGTKVSTWADADTATGGQGQPVGSVGCETSEAYHIHAHLGIFQNGQPLAVPSHIGIVATPACTYATHTHDRSGVIHVESAVAPPTPYTLGELFAIWGQTLSATEVAGITDPSIVVYVNDNGSVAQWTGNIGDIELLAHREITIQIGTPLSELPTYDFTAPLNP